MSANDCGNWPKQQNQERDKQAIEQQGEIQHNALMEGRLLKHEEWEIQAHNEVAGRITVEREQILTAYFPEQQWANLSKMFRLSIDRVRQVDSDGAIRMG